MPGPLERLSQCTGFQWDEGNAQKNWLVHGVSQGECEEVFFNTPFLVVADEAHSMAESRFYALGQSDAGRGLFIVFTIRGTLIRTISARDMNRRGRKDINVPKSTKRRPIPKFASEDRERAFWAKKDSSHYVDWGQAEAVSLPKLRPSTRTISIRLPEPMIERLKVLANKRDVPYQSLLKLFVAERIEEELRES